MYTAYPRVLNGLTDLEVPIILVSRIDRHLGYKPELSPTRPLSKLTNDNHCWVEQAYYRVVVPGRSPTPCEKVPSLYRSEDSIPLLVVTLSIAISGKQGAGWVKLHEICNPEEQKESDPLLHLIPSTFLVLGYYWLRT